MRLLCGSVLAVSLSGCIRLHQARLGAGEEPTLIGPAVRDNRTPMDPALACLAGTIGTARTAPLVIGVGDVRDYTGKYSVNEGNAITQGGALMVTSALGKLGGAVRLAERFDPTIAERELGYTDRRQLGDGKVHDVAGPTGAGKVPWLPYYGGSIAASDYYIVGGITELNYDIRSGGIDAEVNQLGPKARIFTQSVAIDLRIVDTRTLLVIRTVSLTKQFTGYEVGFNLFRFFGSNLFDINAGAKGQEPLQLGIRTALEEATIRLVGAVSKVDPEPCLGKQTRPPVTGAVSPVSASASDAIKSSSRGAAGANLVTAANKPSAMPGGAIMATDAAFRLSFDLDQSGLSGTALADVSRIAAAAAARPVEIILLAPDTESPDPGKRDTLTDRRIATVVAALLARGIAARSIGPLWRPDRADGIIRRDGAGLQRIARLHIG
jgi:curli biogenesis system outer membrane secretion channel CsgG